MSRRPKTAIAQLKVRLDEPLRAKLEKSAKQRPPRGLSLNAEIVNRLEQSFHWDQTLGNIKKAQTDSDEIIAEGKKAALLHWGFQPVAGRDGLWVESNKIRPAEMLELNPTLEVLIERVVLRTIEKVKQS